MKKSLSIAASIAMALGSIVAQAPVAQAAPQDNLRMTAVTESRAITHLTNFQAESDERSVRISGDVTLSSAQYAAIGSGKRLTMTMALKTGSTVVARETSVNVSGAISNLSYGSNTFLTNSTAGSVELYATFEANLLPSTNYQVEIQIFVDGVLKTINSDYTITAITGQFTKIGSSVVAGGGESNLSFRGETCLSSSAYSTLVDGDILEISVSDAAANTYSSISGDLRRSGGMSNYFYWNNSTSKYEAAITSQMLSEKVYIVFSTSVSAPASGTYAPEVSIKKAGSATELSTLCVTAPSAAPTLAASATGITMTVDPAGASRTQCYIADARYPNMWINRTSTYGSQTTCLFTGLKQGNYVGWFERQNNLSQSNATELTSALSPLSTSVAYAGGNAAYRTYTGTSGGSGQGSLAISNISYEGSDFQTERRVSDGNGGLLVGSMEGPDNEIKIRQLTPTGMSSSFGGSGVVSVSLPPVNIRTGTPSVGWYGTNRDKWMAMVTLPGVQSTDGYNLSSGLTSFITGNYANGTQSSVLLSNTDISRFCQANISGQDNVSQWSYLQSVVSAPTADPLLIVTCEIRHGNSSSYYSQVPFLVTYSNGQLVHKATLGDEPTTSEKCSSTMLSAVNSGATGSEVMLAAFQRTWNPSGSDCWTYNGPVPSANVVSRDIFTVTSSYAVTATRDVMTVSGTNEPVLGSSGGMGMSATMRLIVSGPNTHLLTSEVSGSSPNQIIKYRIARLTNGSFGTYENQPYMNVASTDSFNSGTSLNQIADYSENEAGSVLLSRSDLSTGSTAARVDLSTGTMTSYQQMASSSSMGMTDGGSLILGNSSGALNFYGITSRTTAVLGQWTTSGAFDPALTALPINQGASNTGVVQNNPGPNPGPQQGPAAAPYTGPVVKAPGITRTVTKGMKVKIEGSALTSVSKVTIDGKDAKVKVNSEGEIEIVVPSDLANGTYDMVVTSASGVLTVQDAVRVGPTATLLAGDTKPSTKLKEDGTVKVHIYNVIGAGKVQIFVNGVEIAWVNAEDGSDPKLLNDYLVRTIDLAEGKNVIEIYVNLKRVDRKAYTLVDDSSKI
jgi:hypothetical protein